MIHARPLGWVQWVCPNCLCLHGSERVSWRNGRLMCSYCQRTFIFGVRFSSTGMGLPPFHSGSPLAWDRKWEVNSVDDPRPFTPAIARIKGLLQWQCPACRVYHASGTLVSWESSEVVCPTCQQIWQVGVWIHPARRGPVFSPRDYAPPMDYEQQVSDADLLEAAAGPDADRPRAGADRDGTGDDPQLGSRDR